VHQTKFVTIFAKSEEIMQKGQKLFSIACSELQISVTECQKSHEEN
jgi:hypothetical protein